MSIKKLILWFGIFGSIASILSVIFIFFPRDENIKLIVNTKSVERLTQNFEENEPDLTVKYEFKGLEIKNLWKYNIEIQNKSRKTLIGNGNQKNILSDNLLFELYGGYSILDYKKIKSDFNSNLIVDSTSVKIFFEQWRENEIFEYSFYVKTNLSKPDTIILMQPEYRQIVDGDILFNQFDTNNSKDRITQFIPQKFRLAGYVVSMIFLGLFIVMLTIFTIMTPASYYKISKWKTRNYEKYSDLIKQDFQDNQSKQKLYLKRPKDAPNLIWEKFEGEKYPDVSVELSMNKLHQPILIVLIFTVIDISLIITFMELIYLF